MPRYVIIENVPGIQWIAKGTILKKIKESLRKTEYIVKHTLLKAEEYGVPQKRRRVFIFACLNPKSYVFQIHYLPALLIKNLSGLTPMEN